MSSRLLTGAGIECRHAARGLARAPGFAAGVVLVLGIAIAGMVTVTTAAYELFLRPLPFAHPEQLAHVTTYSRSMGFNLGFSPPMLAELREQPMISDVAAYNAASDVESPQGDSWSVAPVTYNLPQVLSVQPIAGRSFGAADAEPGASPVALISESAWRNRFDAAESAIGSELLLEGRHVRVIGVMPAAFTVPSPGTELWEPLRYTPEELAPANIGRFSGDAIVVRLEPGVTPAQLEDALRAGYASDPRLDAQRIRALMKLELNVRGLRDAWTAEQRQPLAIIGLASALVLAAALFNVAGLWMTRLLGRSHEDAIQAALGAGAWRRLGRTLVEFLLLGAAGVSLALALAPLMLGWLKQLGALNLEQPLAIETGPVTIAIAAVVLAVSGLPVLLAALWQQRRQRRELLGSLSGGGRGYAGSSARARRVLIVAQLALAMSLLCAMGLLLRSWYSLLTEDLGFEPRNLLVARIESPRDPAEGQVATDPAVAAALDALRAIPGVTAVTRANVAPFARSASISRISVPGREAWSTTVYSRNVGEGFFRTTGIPLLRGRGFDESEGALRDAVVDERFEELYFPAVGVIGATIRMPAGPGESQEVVIVGVAATAKYRSPDEEASQGSIYLFRREPLANEIAVLAAAVPPASLVDEVTSALARTVGPERTGSIATMESLVRYSVRDREPQLILLGLFALETLALAAIGLFSLLA
ncbi:MAG TPA: ABC transporter permease, partial [Woeseiaceae bacterium]|nr:ABC transporter permease [Woeseiaceae bacterium]